ncbi:MAG: acetate kinase [Methylococcaceae bacterium]|nr:acetate kinase [Methylococcaceae bacterium]
MKILVINCGSSSIKFSLFQEADEKIALIADGMLEKIGETESRLLYRSRVDGKLSPASERGLKAEDHREAFVPIVDALRAEGPLAHCDPDAIGHRVVHGGETFIGPALVDDEVLAQIRSLCPLAPLHNPVNLLGIDICRKVFPHSPQIAVFDTAFHQTLPPRAYRYAVPEAWFERYGIRRYGFHGTSHQYLTMKAADYLGCNPHSLKLIILHLGNGASATAVKNGNSIDTSMGFTPAEGLVMGTRSGDLDPVAALYAAELFGIEQTRQDLLHRSGLKGLCRTNDMREILVLEAKGDEEARLAVELYCYRIQQYIGAYFAILGGIDALIFSGGIGENSPPIRSRIINELECLGLVIDDCANHRCGEILEIQAEGNRTKILVIRTDEALEIARQTSSALRSI